MRSGGCAANQTFTPEAASVLKQSLSLARRRGHAQLTPLHVAVTLFSSRSSSLLRQACLKSQPHQTSHPLHCRALELCFNVALNRLPTTPGPLFHGQPSLSNALIAALKRAQANQRRGCLEQQQQQQQQQHQPVLAIKVELEQLIISILDDPSVSRVMREAGFSSTLVKNNIEDSSVSSVFNCYSSSGGIFSSPSSPSRADHHPDQRDNMIYNPVDFWQTHFLTHSSERNPLPFSPQQKVSSTNTISESASSLKLDIKLVLEALLGRKKKNTVIIGDSTSVIEGVIAELMARVTRGEVPSELKSTKFIEFSLSPDSLSAMKREDIEMKVAELRRNIDSLASRGWGAIIYIGDLKWMVETDVRERGGSSITKKEASGYSQIEHVIEEIARLISFHRSSCTKLWILGTATYQTYMRCQMRHPTLDTQWDLQAVPVPSDGALGLSLHTFRYFFSSFVFRRLSFVCSVSIMDTSSLVAMASRFFCSLHGSRMPFSQNPSQVWETKPFSTATEDQDKLTCCADCSSSCDKKELPSWLQPFSSQLSSLKNQERFPLHSNESSSGSNFLNAWGHPLSTRDSIFQDSNTIAFDEPVLKPSRSSNQMLRFRRQQSCITEFSFDNNKHKYQAAEPSLDSLKNVEEENKELNISLSLGDSIFNESKKLAIPKKNEGIIQRDHLCNILRENVPWQSETIPSMAEALINNISRKKEFSCIVIEGDDQFGKRRLARAIAESVFGSAELLCQLNMRSVDEGTPFSQVLENAMKTQEKLVFLVEDIDQADTQFMKFLEDGFQRGNFGETDGKSGQFIFVLTRGEGRYHDIDPIIPMTLNVAINSGFGALSLDQKRRAEWDSPNNTKHQKTIKEEEDANPIAVEDAKINKSLSRQSSLSILDLNLNLKAEEDEESQEKTEDYRLKPTETNAETATNLQTQKGFLHAVQNRFVFNRSSASTSEMTEIFKSKINQSFAEVFGTRKLASFSVEDRVLEAVSSGSGSFGYSQFEKWLKDIFQTSLRGAVGFGGKEGADVRLCLGGDGKEDQITEIGFVGTNLPQSIRLSFMD